MVAFTSHVRVMSVWLLALYLICCVDGFHSDTAGYHLHLAFSGLQSGRIPSLPRSIASRAAIKHHVSKSFPLRSRLLLFMTNEQGSPPGEQHPLFKLADLIPVECQEASDCLRQAASHWTCEACEWSEIAESLEQAAQAFQHDDNNCFSSFSTEILIDELYDISTIEGCMSLGPATSIPNWIAIRDEFVDTGHDEMAVIVDELITYIENS